MPDSASSTRLDVLEAQSIFVIREAHARLNPLAMLWSAGKDSNVLLWLARKAFLGQVPFACALLDTGDEFDEVYAFRDRYAREWSLDMRTVPCPPVAATDPALPPAARAAQRKTLGLKNFIAEEKLAGLLVGIRADEQAVRAKEPYASPRGPLGTWDPAEQPPELWEHLAMDRPPGGHVRVHPLVDWTELDIWLYIRREGVPVLPLYFARGGMRFRTVGEKSITRPFASKAATLDAVIDEVAGLRTPERAGRTMDHEREDAFERLRADGYM
ncbi:MAG: sulfate adenylyltransferase subunit CysD [Proteobacteria bacterium]|nr:sulfate adenylyltransferase subunit CysD [Pseudomonadota bacterium]